MRFLKVSSGRAVLSLLLVLSGVAMIAVGLLRAEQETVLQKAVHICLECIGIG